MGIYSTFFWVNGQKTAVHVDDYIPTIKDLNQGKAVPLSLVTQEQEIWGILYEKAWVKLHGSYQRIECGLAHNALYCMTGKPTWRHMHQYTPNLFELI
jgi:hypothetical protein